MRPADEAELSDCIRDATGPLRIVGGGTRPGPDVASGDPLETGGMTGIVLYEPGALALVVRAGTPLAEVQAELDAEGQRLPFEPPDFAALPGRSGRSTIGGVVATNASGPARVRAGACRDSLIGVRFVDGSGRVVKNGGRVMKNVTGYDLAKLMAGSHGTLGVLSEVSFKLLPRPETSATLVVHGLDDPSAVRVMSAALGSPYEVTGAAHWSGAGTCLRVEGFAGSVAYRVVQLRALLSNTGEIDVLADAPSKALWAALRDVAPLQDAEGDTWRVSVQPSAAAVVVDRIRPEAHFYDWGGGLIWMSVGAGTDVRAALSEVPGHATLVRPGSGETSTIPRFPPLDPTSALISARLRAAFDPRGILNPGLMA